MSETSLLLLFIPVEEDPFEIPVNRKEMNIGKQNETKCNKSLLLLQQKNEEKKIKENEGKKEEKKEGTFLMRAWERVLRFDRYSNHLFNSLPLNFSSKFFLSQYSIYMIYII